MKMILATALVLTFSVSAFSKVEFLVVRDSETCKVKDNTATVTTTLKNAPLTFSLDKTFTVTGLEDLSTKAASHSTGIVNSIGYIYDVIIDGVHSTLNSQDSTEAMYLVTFLNKVCK